MGFRTSFMQVFWIALFLAPSPAHAVSKWLQRFLPNTSHTCPIEVITEVIPKPPARAPGVATEWTSNNPVILVDKKYDKEYLSEPIVFSDPSGQKKMAPTFGKLTLLQNGAETIEVKRSAGSVKGVVHYAYDGKEYYILSTETPVGSYMTIFDSNLREIHTEHGTVWDPYSTTFSGVGGTEKPEFVMLSHHSEEELQNGRVVRQSSTEVRRLDPLSFQPIAPTKIVPGEAAHKRILDDGTVQLFMYQEPSVKAAIDSRIEMITLPSAPEMQTVNTFDQINHRIARITTVRSANADFLVYTIDGTHSIDQMAMFKALPERDARIAYLEKNTINTSSIIVSHPSTPANPISKIEVDFLVKQMKVEIKNPHTLVVHLSGSRGGVFVDSHAVEKTIEIQI